MITKRSFSTLLLSFLFSYSFSQQAELKVNLRDGNVITGKGSLGNIQLLTEFGKLDIPLKRVSSIEFGIAADQGIYSKVEKLVLQLGNSNEEMRRSAFNELVALNINAIPALEKALSSEKYQPSTYQDFTPENALGELKNIYGVTSFNENDVVLLDNGNNISGSFELKKIDLKTSYGSLSIPKENISSVEVTYTGGESGEGNKTFKLQASKHVSSNPNGGWVKTGINVKTGQRIEITATGQVTFASLSGAIYKPDGSTAANAAYPSEETYYGSNAYPTYGNLVYKIGESGTMMKAGSRLNTQAGSSGALYISIYETVFNPANTGSYNVQVSVK